MTNDLETETAEAAGTIGFVLEDIVRLNATHRKVAEALHRAYKRQAGTDVHRQQLERWICANSKRRQSPRLGTGLNLALAAAAVLAAHKDKPFHKRNHE